VFPVRHEMNVYILFRTDSVFEGLKYLTPITCIALKRQRVHLYQDTTVWRLALRGAGI
jgi:hypothetical protein